MKVRKIELIILISALIFFAGCNSVKVAKADNSPTPQTKSSKKDLSEVDLTKIGHIAPKGRVQDKEINGIKLNNLQVIDDLLSNGKDSIPFLIDKLDDETLIEGQVLDFWYENSVADVSLVILNNFFSTDDGMTSTIPGFGWDEFLERGNDKNAMGEEILRRYIERHGRQNIKERWQKMWDENKENIYWDESERCFKVRN